MPNSKLESFLVADIGSAQTKVGLVDLVGEEFRFIGAAACPTTINPPDTDVLTGLTHAIAQIQARTGRALLTEDQQVLTPERPIGGGVDAYVAVTSAPAPLRVAIVGLSREVSLQSAIRATQGTYAIVAATLALDEVAGRWMRPIASASSEPTTGAPATAQDPAVVAATALAQANPEVIVIVGGIDGGATTALYDLTNLVATLVAAREESARPTLIFAGNRDARPHINARIGQIAPLRVVDNVRPTLAQENIAPLRHELESLYAEKKIAWLPGMNALSSHLAAPPLATARAFENVVRFLARRYGLGVLGADIGSATTSVVMARGETYTRVVCADLGIGRNIVNAVTRDGVLAPLDWLPLDISADEARQDWFNHALRPLAIPTTREEVYLMHAAARAALATAARQGGIDPADCDLVLLTGGVFANSANPGALALLALDALQPRGIFTLAVDALGLAPAFGALAAISPAAAAQVLERDGLVTLGTVIAPLSRNRDGVVDLRVQVQPADGGALGYEVPHGSLELVPLATGQKATIQARVTSGVDLEGATRGTFKAQIEGGALGLVLDARGRPIALPDDAEKRRAKIQQWYWDIGGEVSYD